MTRLRLRWLLLVLGACGAAGWRWAGPAVAQEGRARAALTAADRYFGEKSYAAALKEYRAALAGGGDLGGRRAEAEYRLAVSLGKAEQWDEALKEGEAFVARHPRSIWAARGHYWMGRLYLAVPHAGYKVAGRIVRGDDVPRAEGPEPPERVWLQGEDQKKSLDHFETAKTLFHALTGRTRAEARDEEIDLNFDLARVLQGQPLWRKAEEWRLPTNDQRRTTNTTRPNVGRSPLVVRRERSDPWKIDPAARYGRDWPTPKKILTLYAEIGRLGGSKAHKSALAALARALFLGGYQAQMPHIARRWDATRREWIPLPYPYQELKEEDALRALIARFSRDQIAPQVALRLGMLKENAADYVGAIALYREVPRRWPKSKWVSDARARIDNITRRQLSMQTSAAQLPGKPARMVLVARNLKEVRFTAYRVRLEDVLARKIESNSDHNLASFRTLFGDTREYGPVVARWQKLFPRAEDHRYVQETIETPLNEMGAYVVEAEGPQVSAAAILLITDLALVSKTSRQGLLGFVVDARTGKPVAGAKALVRERWSSENGTSGVRAHRLDADGDGLYAVPRPATEGRGTYVFDSLAWVGDRYAVSERLWHNPYRVWDRQRFLTYTYTDRSVYRPGQAVHYRVMTSERTEGELRPRPLAPLVVPAGRALHVRVTDPKGVVVHETDAKTGEFGSINGSFTLGTEPPLGEYYVQVTLPNTNAPLQDAGGNRFRVEEYKKPEYEVTVAPDKDQARVGERVSAVVKARYYFGAPVGAARVSYKVFRTRLWPTYRFPRPFDWLYRYWNEGDYPPGPEGGDLVASGNGTTDANGELRVAWETRAEQPQWQNLDMRYTVQAEVTDASRRVITGSGDVKATRRAFYAFLDLQQEYFQAGDRVPVEVATRDASERPVAAKGRLRVYRQHPDGPDKVREERVHDAPLATGADGRATATWESESAGGPPAAGQYRIAFEAADAWDQEVVASTVTWVAGPGLDNSGIRLQGVRLLLDREHYAEGETARLLVVAERPESTVLVTVDAGDAILSRQVLRISGRSETLAIPIARGHAPNCHVTATMVRDGQVHQVEREILVPPVRELLNVAVTPDRARYHPGEKATFRITATDWRGRPARAELSVGVVDAALAYIQKSYAPDLRVFCYGERRGHSIPMQTSLHASLESRSVDNQPRPKHTLHEWTLPDGMGQLPDWPGFQGNLHDLYFQSGYTHLGAMTGGFGGDGRFRDRLAENAAPEMAAAPGPPGPPGPAGAGGALRREARQLAKSADRGERDDKAAGPGGEGAVRSNFADTAFWTPAVVTGADGTATVTVTWPDNLTTWQATTRGWSQGAQVGQAEGQAVTYKDLIVRLQAPRFFVERDLVVISGVVHNGTDRDLARVTVRLGIDGDGLELVDAKSLGGARLVADAAPTLERTVAVAKRGETRIDWIVRVRREGSVKLRVAAKSDADADAMELSFPVLVHGVEKLFVANGAMLDGDQRRTTNDQRGGTRTDTLTLTVPKERKPGSSELVVQLSPSLAATMLDALPYLADYPYGCVEQTMSRFLPSVVVARTLSGSGIDLETLGRRARALEERRPTTNDQRPTNSPYSYPKGRPGVLQTAALAQGLKRSKNPVFDSARLQEMVRDGLQRLLSFQHGDGGWGWWRDDSSDPQMTSYVLYGLHTAKAAGVAVPGEVLARGFRFLLPHFLEGDDFERMACYGYVLSLDPGMHAAVRPLLTGRLYDRRERLGAYAKAHLALALHAVGARDPARVVLENIETTAKVDEGNGTVHWAPVDRFWWRWYNNTVETNAMVLRALVTLQPESRLAPMLVKWLVNNRRGGIWHSTRETAMAVYALADYMRETKELTPEITVTVDLEGRVRREFTITAENALLFDNRFVVPDALLQDGPEQITITKRGPGRLYYSAYLRTFSLEEDIAAAGHEIAVRRRHFKLIPEVATNDQRPTTNAPATPSVVGRSSLVVGRRAPAPSPYDDTPTARLTYRRVPIEPGTPLSSGDLIETELFLEAKNDYDYVVFEDIKPAGCEPVELRSGAAYGDGLCANMELRDQKVAFFITHLPQGTRRLTYRMRAEIPGQFHVLPTNGYAMYAPDVRAISDEARFAIRDREEARQAAR